MHPIMVHLCSILLTSSTCNLHALNLWVIALLETVCITYQYVVCGLWYAAIYMYSHAHASHYNVCVNSNTGMGNLYNLLTEF